MAYYNFKVSSTDEGVLLEGSFGEPATNAQIVEEVTRTLADAADNKSTLLKLGGGRLLKVSGPMSLPLAFVVAHITLHRFGAVACYDPKLQGFVVSVSHDPQFVVGAILK